MDFCLLISYVRTQGDFWAESVVCFICAMNCMFLYRNRNCMRKFLFSGNFVLVCLCVCVYIYIYIYIYIYMNVCIMCASMQRVGLSVCLFIFLSFFVSVYVICGIPRKSLYSCSSISVIYFDIS